MTGKELILSNPRLERFPDLAPALRDALCRALRLERRCGEIVRAAKGGLPQSDEARAFYDHVAALKRQAWARYFRLERERRQAMRENAVAESRLTASQFQFVN